VANSTGSGVAVRIVRCRISLSQLGTQIEKAGTFSIGIDFREWLSGSKFDQS